MKLNDKTLQKLIAFSDNPTLRKNDGEWIELKVYYYRLLFKENGVYWFNPVTGSANSFLECFRKRLEMELRDLRMSN